MSVGELEIDIVALNEIDVESDREAGTETEREDETEAGAWAVDPEGDELDSCVGEGSRVESARKLTRAYTKEDI